MLIGTQSDRRKTRKKSRRETYHGFNEKRNENQAEIASGLLLSLSSISSPLLFCPGQSHNPPSTARSTHILARPLHHPTTLDSPPPSPEWSRADRHSSRGVPAPDRDSAVGSGSGGSLYGGGRSNEAAGSGADIRRAAAAACGR